MPEFRFFREEFRDFYDEAAPLLKSHWDEIAKNKQLLYINTDMGAYQRAEDAKRLVIVTARSGFRLVGYFVWALNPHPHYKHVTVAEEDLHYLLPEFRKGLNGYLLIKEALKAAKDVGADLCSVREKVGMEHPAIMKRLGLTATDIVYTKTLGD